MDIKIRPFNETDTKEVADVNYAALRFSFDIFRINSGLEYFSKEMFERDWEKFYENSDGKKALIATDDNKTVGVVMYSTILQSSPYDWRIRGGSYLDFEKMFSRNIGEIQQCLVLPEYTRKKVASMLCLKVFEDMRRESREFVVTKRIKGDRATKHFQENSLLSESFASRSFRDVRNGKNNALENVEFTAIVSLSKVGDTLIHLNRVFGLAR